MARATVPSVPKSTRRVTSANLRPLWLLTDLSQQEALWQRQPGTAALAHVERFPEDGAHLDPNLVGLGVSHRHRPVSPRRHLAPCGYTVVVDAFQSTITPVLTVRNAAQAVAFYQKAFGAQEIYRNTYPDGRIVAEMAVGAARFRVADEAPEAANLSPQTLKGTTVRINLLVADPDAVAKRAIANGAIEVAPIADQSYGLRQGRLADPFGHHWLIGRPLEGEAGGWAQRRG